MKKIIYNKKMLLIIFLGIIFFNSAVFLLININEKQRINIALNKNLELLETQYNTLLHNQKVDADAIYYTTVSRKNVINILSSAGKIVDKKQREKLRNELYDILKFKYDMVKTKGVFQYHFVLPNNKVFLRMHKPSKFDDCMSIVRPDFKKVNDTKEIVRGFSQGKTSHAFRNIYPIYDLKDNYLGALDISYTSNHLQNYLTSVNKIHTHFLVNKNIFSVKAWDNDNLKLKYITSSEHTDFMFSVTEKHNIKTCVTTNIKRFNKVRSNIDMNIKKGKPFAIYDNFNEVAQVISFYPIVNNVSDKKVAWLVSYTDSPFIDLTILNGKVMRYILFFLSLVFGYLIYKNLIHKITLQLEIKNKTKDLQKITDNLTELVRKEIGKNRDKEKILFEQSKSVQMGEMIGNIAHQWRQPLSAISILASSITMQRKLGLVTDEELEDTMQDIVDKTKHLSETINVFRNFIEEDKVLKDEILQNSIKEALEIVGTVIKDVGLELIDEVDYKESITLTMVSGELSQVIINIINNAKDVLLERKIIDGKIYISLIKETDKVILVIKDNAGGIPEDILPRIFDPYFTTKHQSQGTGLGLHMSADIVRKSLKGKLYAKNDDDGAVFYIEILLENKNK
ncbi:MAG: ATP-binding protein [Patescibacteria group bacterium]|nr:ATP-binding protein [Patescibacteria group bacterium]